MTPIDFALATVAVFRATRLLTDDAIFAFLRRLAPESAWGDFIECPWCVSIWVAGVAVLSHHLMPIGYWRACASVLALSALAALIAIHLDE